MPGHGIVAVAARGLAPAGEIATDIARFGDQAPEDRHDAIEWEFEPRVGRMKSTMPDIFELVAASRNRECVPKIAPIAFEIAVRTCCRRYRVSFVRRQNDPR